MHQLSDVEFAENHDPTCPCLLLLDTSASMGGAPIESLNAGLRLFQQEVLNDPIARNRVDVAIVTFGHGGVQTVQPFANISQFEAPHLSVGGQTPMGEAIERGLDMLLQRKKLFHENGIPYYRPWIILITDGAPTDKWQNAAQRVHHEEELNALAFFAIGAGNADMSILAQVAVRKPLKLQGIKFAELFLWLSASQKRVSASKIGEQVALPVPEGWATV